MGHEYGSIARRVLCTSAGVTLSLCLLTGPSSAAQPGMFTDSAGQTIYREFLPHKKANDKKIEMFWTKPDGAGPWPAIVYIHGHQEPARDGGEVYVKGGRLRLMAMRGYVAASVSQPGYGNSDGPPDYCGPFTQDAVLEAIEFLRNKPFVKPNKVALYGYREERLLAQWSRLETLG